MAALAVYDRATHSHIDDLEAPPSGVVPGVGDRLCVIDRATGMPVTYQVVAREFSWPTGDAVAAPLPYDRTTLFVSRTT